MERLRCMVEFTEWIELPLPIAEYSISSANLKVDKSRVTKLIQDSINEASEKHDFSKYSFMVIFMGARFREYGMIGLCGYPGMLGWSEDTEFRAKDGQRVPGELRSSHHRHTSARCSMTVLMSGAVCKTEKGLFPACTTTTFSKNIPPATRDGKMP